MLKATLNAAYEPDYNFDDAQGVEFSREPSLATLMAAVEELLRNTMGEAWARKCPQARRYIAASAFPEDCEIYAYHPDSEADPFSGDGCLWAFNYFLYNRKNKQILFFRGRAQGLAHDDDDHGATFPMEL